MMLSPTDAQALCAMLETNQIGFWVMGGWGVDALSGQGVIDGKPVPCVSLEGQIVMHMGYKLLPTHQADLELLMELKTLTICPEIISVFCRGGPHRHPRFAGSNPVNAGCGVSALPMTDEVVLPNREVIFGQTLSH